MDILAVEWRAFEPPQTASRASHESEASKIGSVPPPRWQSRYHQAASLSIRRAAASISAWGPRLGFTICSPRANAPASFLCAAVQRPPHVETLLAPLETLSQWRSPRPYGHYPTPPLFCFLRQRQVRVSSSVQLLQVSLGDQPLHVPLPHVKLAVLRQRDGPVESCQLLGAGSPAIPRRGWGVTEHAALAHAHPYSVWISPASFKTLTSMKRSLGGSRLPVRSMSVHWPLYAASKSPYCRT